MAIRLEPDSHGFLCPNCLNTLSVESWDTEYEDPQVGESRMLCPVCHDFFNIDVSITVNITPSKY